MARFKQTIARLAAGFSAIAALVWVLWPNDFGFLENPEALFTFATALVFWVFTEFHASEEFGTQGTSLNDIRVARELVELHAGELRTLLNDPDFWTFTNSEAFSMLRSLLDRWERGVLIFNNNDLNHELSELMGRLDALSMKIASDTVPIKLGGVYMTGYKPVDYVSDEEYKRLRRESTACGEIAKQAWNILDRMIKRIRSRIPNVLDKPID